MGAPTLTVVGGGSAAITAAKTAVALGARVTMVHEGLPVGGTCLHVGCVPAKFMVRAAEAHRHTHHHRFAGLQPRGADLDFRAVIEQQQSLITELRQTNYEATLPSLKGLTMLRAYGRLLDPHSVEADGRRIRSDAILLATGSSTDLPPIPGLAEVNPLTNETLFSLPQLPRSLLVVGGGYIALETAQTLARFGCEVTVLQRSGHLLSKLAPDLGGTLQRALEEEGVRVLCDSLLLGVERRDGRIRVMLEHRGAPQTLEAESLFVGLGRRGNTERLNLDAVGVKTHGRGFIETNAHLRTSCPTIWAAGDVLGGRMFVYTASQEAEIAVNNLLGHPPRTPDNHALPWVVFTDPQVAGTGLDAEEAVSEGYEIEVAELPVARWPRFRVSRQTTGFLRLVRDRNSDLLLGARCIAPEGGDLMGELSLIIRERIPLQRIAERLYPYLTLCEGIQRCAAKFYGP